MVNDLVENRALCELYPLKQNDCDEMASARLQAQDMLALQDYVDAQYGGPGKGWLRIVRSPAEARRVINEGKLAMVFGMETSEVFGCGQFNGTPRCDAAQIDRQLDEFHALGVRSVFPVHKFDNALGGTHFDDGATGVLVNAGNKYATGRFWQADHCDDPDHDNEPTNVEPRRAVLAPMLGPVTSQTPLRRPAARLSAGAAVQPEGPDRAGRALDPRDDRARDDRRDRPHERARAPSDADHPRGRGVLGRDLEPQLGRRRPARSGSSAWAASSARYAGDSDGLRRRLARGAGQADPRYLFGVGLRVGHQRPGCAAGPPRPDAALNPVRYPFRTFDGGT